MPIISLYKIVALPPMQLLPLATIGFSPAQLHFLKTVIEDQKGTGIFDTRVYKEKVMSASVVNPPKALVDLCFSPDFEAQHPECIGMLICMTTTPESLPKLELAPVNKGEALTHFATQVGVPLHRILTMGDGGHNTGNDRHLLAQGTLAYHVGHTTPQHDGAIDTKQLFDSTGPKASAKVIRSLMETRPLLMDAAAFDYDSTIGEDRGTITQEMVTLLIDLMHLVPVAIITGSSFTTFTTKCARLIGALSQKPGLVDRFHVYTYHGCGHAILSSSSEPMSPDLPTPTRSTLGPGFTFSTGSRSR